MCTFFFFAYSLQADTVSQRPKSEIIIQHRTWQKTKCTFQWQQWSLEAGSPLRGRHLFVSEVLEGIKYRDTLGISVLYIELNWIKLNWIKSTRISVLQKTADVYMIWSAEIQSLSHSSDWETPSKVKSSGS